MTPTPQRALLGISAGIALASAVPADPLNPPRCPVDSPLVRLTSACYNDGISAPRTMSAVPGELLPSARHISNVICAQSTEMPSPRALSAMVFQWGQFIDHDITLVTTGAASFPIEVPAGDPQFDPGNTGTVEIPLSRSTGTGSPLQQINRITSLIDGSAVYGSDAIRADALRLYTGGLLKTSSGPDGDLLPFNTEDPPLDNANENPFLVAEDLFLAGDVRSNEQSALTAVHTLFVREHNRLAGEIAAANPGFSDQQIYEEACRWVAAILQSITFNEFLPAVLGAGGIPAYTGYDPNVDPCISNEFSGAAYRVGHSMLPSTLPRLDPALQEIPAGNLALEDAFFRPDQITGFGIDPYLRGLACAPLQATDCFVVDDVRNFLFGPPGAGGLDLAALNIQRGRDHGLPSYNAVRTELGLTPATTFADITSSPVLQADLDTAYDGQVDDVDLWIGGMGEDYLPGAVLGELFCFLWIDQFTRLRDGDPCWFENTDPDTNPHPFTPTEIETINATTLGDVMARNSGAAFAGINVFVLPAPRISAFTYKPQSNEVSLTWSSFLNAPYDIQVSNDFGTHTPFTLLHSETGADGTTTATFHDPAAANTNRRGYRVLQR